MKVREKYEPKNVDEYGTFDAAMTRLLAVPAQEIQRKIAKDKKKKAKSKASEPGASRDSGKASGTS